MSGKGALFPCRSIVRFVTEARLTLAGEEAHLHLLAALDLYPVTALNRVRCAPRSRPELLRKPWDRDPAPKTDNVAQAMGSHLRAMLRLDTCAYLLRLSQRYQQLGIREAVLEFIWENFDDVAALDSWLQLEREDVLAVTVGDRLYSPRGGNGCRHNRLGLGRRRREVPVGGHVDRGSATRPLFLSTTGEVAVFEALLRWVEARHADIDPGDQDGVRANSAAFAAARPLGSEEKAPSCLEDFRAVLSSVRAPRPQGRRIADGG